MTIDIIEVFWFTTNDRAKCAWFAKNELKEEVIELHLLKKV
jgi:hypothetical protein